MLDATVEVAFPPAKPTPVKAVLSLKMASTLSEVRLQCRPTVVSGTIVVAFDAVAFIARA